MTPFTPHLDRDLSLRDPNEPHKYLLTIYGSALWPSRKTIPPKAITLLTPGPGDGYAKNVTEEKCPSLLTLHPFRNKAEIIVSVVVVVVVTVTSYGQ